VGEQFYDVIVVKSGLSEGQQVVASGQFLIDSEASLQGVMARAAPAASAAAAGGAARTASARPEYRTRGRFVQADASEATLEHEPVPELKWPAMTMPFKLADPQLAARLRALKPGQPLTFTFVKQGDDWAIKSIEVAPAAPAAPASTAASRPGAPR
jgi:Cu(I)/Ag(I) efflux system membrane fusion protein